MSANPMKIEMRPHKSLEKVDYIRTPIKPVWKTGENTETDENYANNK